MPLEYVRVLHFSLRVCGSANRFYLTLFEKSIWYYRCAKSAARRIAMTITDLASLLCSNAA
jgi:hypothetical protein